VALYGLSDGALWAVASGGLLSYTAVAIGRTQWERSQFSKKGFGPFVWVSFAGL
jgi:hypothetical protein